MNTKRNKVKLFKHQILITIISVFALVVSMVGGSYAIFSSSDKGEYNVITVGDLDISYVDKGDGYGDILSLNGAYPMSDSEGREITPYRFNVENTSSMPIDFKIKILNDTSIIELDGCSNNLLDPKFIKVQFDNNSPILLSSLESSGYTIYSETGLTGRSSEIHNIRVWITDTVSGTDNLNDVLGKHFHGKVVVETSQSGVDEKLKTALDVGNKVILKDGSVWHVLKESSNSSAMVTLLSDYNLRVDEGHEGEYDNTCGKGLTNNIFACSPIEFDTEGMRIDTYCGESENGCNLYQKNGTVVLTDSSIKTWLETNYIPKLRSSLTNTTGATLEDLSVSIPTAEEIASASGKTFNQAILSNTLNDNFLVTTNYWTKSSAKTASSDVWYVSGNDKNFALSYANNNTSIGVRPVITTSKLNIETIVR